MYPSAEKKGLSSPGRTGVHPLARTGVLPNQEWDTPEPNLWVVCLLAVFNRRNVLYCSSLDSDEDHAWIDNVMNYCGSLFPLEDKYGFRFVEQERDFMPG